MNGLQPNPHISAAVVGDGLPADLCARLLAASASLRSRPGHPAWTRQRKTDGRGRVVFTGWTATLDEGSDLGKAAVDAVCEIANEVNGAYHRLELFSDGPVEPPELIRLDDGDERQAVADLDSAGSRRKLTVVVPLSTVDATSGGSLHLAPGGIVPIAPGGAVVFAAWTAWGLTRTTKLGQLFLVTRLAGPPLR